MRVYRSPLRLFLFGVVGLLLMIAAADVMFGQWISTPPESTDGILTTRGLAQQRGDFVWGIAMIGVGALLFGRGVIELIRRRPRIRLCKDGIAMAIGVTGKDVVLPWEKIEAVWSGVETDPYDGGSRDRLFVKLRDRSDLPEQFVGATWNGTILTMDAHDWSKPVTEATLAAQGGLDHYRRVRAITEMEEPSLVWETSVAKTTDPEDDDVTSEGEVS